MVLATWRQMLHQKLRAFREGSSRSRRPRRGTFRPQVIGLEDRCLMDVYLGSTFHGLDRKHDGLFPDVSSEPPDTILAAGPNAIVEVVNLEIAYYAKNTGRTLFMQ